MRPVLTELGEVGRSAASPWSHRDEETGPLGQFNTCYLAQCRNPLCSPKEFRFHFHIIDIYGYVCLTQVGRKHVLCGLEHTIRASK